MSADAVATLPDLYRTVIERRLAWATAFGAAVFGGALCCILLLLRKSAAYAVFVVSLLGAIVTMIDTIGTVSSNVAPAGFLVGNLTQLVVTGFLICYSKRAETIRLNSARQLLQRISKSGRRFNFPAPLRTYNSSHLVALVQKP